LRRDLACAALGLALAAAYWVAADGLPTSILSDSVGADGVPKGLAVLLSAFSLVIGIRALRRPGAAPERKNHLRALGITLLGFAYLAIVPFAGYLVSIALLTAAAAWYYGAPRRADTVVFALGTAALLWAVFRVFLGVGLP
jgi:putative tricarboxylic transport membrane protein